MNGNNKYDRDNVYLCFIRSFFMYSLFHIIYVKNNLINYIINTSANEK